VAVKRGQLLKNIRNNHCLIDYWASLGEKKKGGADNRQRSSIGTSRRIAGVGEKKKKKKKRLVPSEVRG